MISWIVARHRVAIAGHVTDAMTQEAVPGAEVIIVEMPTAFKQKLQYAGGSAQVNKARSRGDGLFYFLDLPDGKYTLTASIPSAGKRYGNAWQKAKVSHDQKGDIKVELVNFALQPTAVEGKITSGGQKSGVLMAQVHVRGSGERTFSDADGKYTLAAIEPGRRTVQVFAQGHSPAAETVLIAAPGESKTLDFNLVKGGK
jgi:hypothetical protein